MTTSVVFAPHPDDETLGCGGTLLREISNGADIHWVVMTAMSEKSGYPAEKIARRQSEIERVAGAYPFTSTHQAPFPAAHLDMLPLAEVVGYVSSIVKMLSPDTLYLPFWGDAHSDHAVVFDAVAACTKAFRYPSVKNVFVYEVLSETDFGIHPETSVFRPNRYVDVSGQLQRKKEIMGMYPGEIGAFPFPRSYEAIDALARLRGLVAGVVAAEAFMVLREIA